MSNIKTTFREAKTLAISLGHEADLNPSSSDIQFTESDLLREGAWVILCSGFRERLVRQIFHNLSICFCNWISAKSIVEHRSVCYHAALDVFGHQQKIKAIINLAERIEVEGFRNICAEIHIDPIQKLQEFKYIGPVTSHHLAKNLGYQMAKPDRHLLRASEQYGYSDVQEFCSAIAVITGESISVVDGVLWRLSVLGRLQEFNFAALWNGRDRNYSALSNNSVRN